MQRDLPKVTQLGVRGGARVPDSRLTPGLVFLFTLSPVKPDPPARAQRREVSKSLREGSWSTDTHQEDERGLEPENQGLKCQILENVLCCYGRLL